MTDAPAEVGTVYHKRFRMEADLSACPPGPALPPGFEWVAWDDAVLDLHALAKARAFAGELDSVVFPNLGSLAGCGNLMRSIRRRDGFCPGATWLLRIGGELAGTVQGVAHDGRLGALQNLGVVPEFRGRALGAALLLKCLAGFHRAGLRRAMLEVTAANAPALALYRRHGFRCTRTIYKPVPAAPPSA